MQPARTKKRGRKSGADADRRAMSAGLRKFNREHPHVIKAGVRLSDIDEFASIITGFLSEARRIQAPYLRRYQSLINLELAVIGLLSFAAFGAKKRNKILAADFPAKDVHLAASLTNIVNTALAILRLTSEGLDTQARVLVRTLDERIAQVLLLYSHGADFVAWQTAQHDSETKRVWYQLFSRKRRLRRRLRELERALGFDLGEEHEVWRDTAEETYSAAVHGGSIPVQVGSFAFDYRSDQVRPALFGCASSLAKPTLAHTRLQLLYFIVLFSGVLRHIHGWKPRYDQRLVAYHVAFREALLASAPEWIGEWIHDAKACHSVPE